MNPFSDCLISASAGTGKTFQLSNRYIGLLHSGVMPDQILATTFTRKAAGEILDRVIVRLADAALEEQECQKLAEQLAIPSLTQARCFELLGLILHQLHRLRVSTLDAFFAQLAGSFSLELALPPGWRIIEELHEKYLRTEAIERTLQGDSSRDVQRLLHLMAKGTAQRSVSEMVRDTVNRLYNLYMETEAAAWQQIPQPKLLTSERLATVIQQLREATLPDKNFAKTRDKDVAAAEIGDWESFIGCGIAAKVLEGETTYSRKPIPSDVIELYEQLLGQARSVLLQQMARQMQATYELLDKFHGIYSQLKQQSGALRFEDITRALAAGERLGSIDGQHFRLDTPFAHLLLDEFQDTSLTQWQVLRPFARFVTAKEGTPPTGTRSGRTSFFCVGDAKQAIYAWRGGKSEIFAALDGDLEGLETSPLTKSFRSSPPVIAAVNRIFQELPRHGNLERFEPAVHQWCKAFPEHTTSRMHLPGYVELCTATEAGDDEQADTAKLGYAAERIREIVARAPGRSVGVLTRRNDVVNRLIYELRMRHVEASEEGGGRLTDSPAVQVILSLLKLADHPGDSVARFHVAQSPLAPHVCYRCHTDHLQTRKLSRDVRTRLLHDGYGTTLQSWAELLEPSCDRRDRNRLQQFVETGYAYEQIATLRTSDFLRYVELKRVADPTAADVRVMTVHQAKGLQFDIVVLADLDAPFVGQPNAFVTGQPSPTAPVDCVCLYRKASIQKLLPERLRKLFEENARQCAAEALCVLYVAVTRAIHALHMIVRPSTHSEKNLPKSAAGLLRAALTDGQPLSGEQVVFCTGDPQWCDKMGPPAVQSEPVATPCRQPEIRLAPMKTDARLDLASPSQLEGGARVRAARLLDLTSAVATARGTLMHALFEQVTWLDDSWPDWGPLRRIAQSLSTPELDIDQQLSSFQRMLEMPEVAAPLRRAFYELPCDTHLLRALAETGSQEKLRAVACNERRFAVRDHDRLLSGIMDRIVLVYQGDRLVAADIVDYKTDAANRDDGAKFLELVEFYRPQIEAYRRAAAAMFHLTCRQVSARLLFVSPGVMCGVEDNDE
ncbi:MAG: UvrD-helicase domain-containing protein [Pirellulaceae bacterium]